MWATPHSTPMAERPATPADSVRFEVAWACNEEDVRQAQQLRCMVFVQETGARLTVPKGTPAGVDADLFDPFCEHVLVLARHCGDAGPGPVIGTYRVLMSSAAKRVSGWYGETEFDLTRL